MTSAEEKYSFVVAAVWPDRDAQREWRWLLEGRVPGEAVILSATTGTLVDGVPRLIDRGESPTYLGARTAADAAASARGYELRWTAGVGEGRKRTREELGQKGTPRTVEVPAPTYSQAHALLVLCTQEDTLFVPGAALERAHEAQGYLKLFLHAIADVQLAGSHGKGRIKPPEVTP